MASGSVDNRETDDRQPWNPTSAKTGQIWGTHHSSPTEISPPATIGFLEVCEKSRLVWARKMAKKCAFCALERLLRDFSSHCNEICRLISDTVRFNWPQA